MRGGASAPSMAVTQETPARVSRPASGLSRPPWWLIVCTGILAAVILVLAVAETGLKAQYLIDEGELISLFGLAFILVAGIVLWRQHRLFASLPLVLPWLIYPVISQGDQIIDNLSINAMRAVCHVLLAAIFAAPVGVLVLMARYATERMPGPRPAGRAWMAVVPGLRQLVEGRRREGSAVLAATLLVLEMWLANRYLGTLMIVTLVLMVVSVLMYGSLPEPPGAERLRLRNRSERFALGVLLVGVFVSAATYIGYKNEPGAYQGSPSFFMDPAQKDKNYQVDRIPVPGGPVAPPAEPQLVRAALVAGARTLERLLAGYHLLERNYTYDFHNELFLRNTPLVPGYRAAGLTIVAEARALRAEADAQAARARSSLKDDDPLAALLDDLRAYLAFNFDRAPVLEEMSEGFQRTQAGLQHAAHLYEGESKYLGAGLSDILGKYQPVVDAPALAPVTSEFVTISRAIYEAYANHIVGF